MAAEAAPVEGRVDRVDLEDVPGAVLYGVARFALSALSTLRTSTTKT